MANQSRKGRKPPGKGGGRKSGKRSGSSRVPIVLAVILPLLLVGTYMLYHSNRTFSRYVDKGAGRVADFFAELGRDDGPAAVAGAPKAGVEDSKRGTEPGERAAPPLPRQRPKTVAARTVPLTVKQAQRIAVKMFSGSITSSNSSPRSFWYTFKLDGTRKLYPYDAAPNKVYVSTVALEGIFMKGATGTVVFVKVQDESGPQWNNTYVGATLLSGTADKPGRVRGSTALQASGGQVTRYEALDIQSDGPLELVLEIESNGPGGYLFRDLALHSFTANGTVVRWSTRTLEDGPGVPLETAEFKNVRIVDPDNDGKLEILVEAGQKQYEIAPDFSRKFKGEKVLSTTTYRQSSGRFKLAGN